MKCPQIITYDEEIDTKAGSIRILKNQDIDVTEFVQSEKRDISKGPNLNQTLNKVLSMRMRDSLTNEIGKATKKRMSSFETRILEQEYLSVGANEMWNKRDLKRIAKKLNVCPTRVYKWCWDKRNLVRQMEKYYSQRSVRLFEVTRP